MSMMNQADSHTSSSNNNSSATSKYAESIRTSLTSHPKVIEKTFQYGTAGFRDRGSELDSVMFRMGILAVLRSKAVYGAAIGVMITASHNPEEDNGVKLIDPQGEMLDPQWESIATQLANVSDNELVSAINDIVESMETNMDVKGIVFLAMDTRSSSKSLAKAVMDGVAAMNGTLFDYGLLTTPQLHYIVHCHNSGGKYGEPSEEGYYKKLSEAFNKASSYVHHRHMYVPCLRVDGANGVGALALAKLIPHISGALQIELFNKGTEEDGRLNYMCGADFVKVQQQVPHGVFIEPGYRYASFDGDGDRIVYFYINKEDKFRLLDGDKIATLIANYLKEEIDAAGLGSDLDLCLVQTAYANGSSTNYIRNTLKIPVSCVPTGVKHLHHQAQQADIGIYFEANGHGTVLFSNKAIRKIKACMDQVSCQEDKHTAVAAEKLLTIIDIINQTVGDAISDLLLVETILREKGWNVETWDGLYNDYPNRQLKVKVKDRTVIKTTDAERTCLSPIGLQSAINTLVGKYEQARAFVRPSGTEDVVRVYAEAATQIQADQLAHEVGMEVYNLAGGVGPTP